MPLYPVTMAVAPLENSLHHAGADTELPADLEDAVAAGLQFENLRLYFGLKPTPAQFRLSPSRAASRRGIRPSSPPAFGIGQRAILARTPAGNVLWDCLDPARARRCPFVRGKADLILALADVCSSG